MAVPRSRAKFVATRWTNRVCFAGKHTGQIPAENRAVARSVLGLQVVCFNGNKNPEHEDITNNKEQV